MTNIAIYNGSPITRPCLYLMQKRVLASLDTHGKWQNVTTYILFTSYVWIMNSKCYHIVLNLMLIVNRVFCLEDFIIRSFHYSQILIRLNNHFIETQLKIFLMLSIANISEHAGCEKR